MRESVMAVRTVWFEVGCLDLSGSRIAIPAPRRRRIGFEPGLAMDADEVIGEISYVGHRRRLLRHVARDAATRRLNRTGSLAARLSAAGLAAGAVDLGAVGGMALQASRLVPLRLVSAFRCGL